MNGKGISLITKYKWETYTVIMKRKNKKKKYTTTGIIQEIKTIFFTYDNGKRLGKVENPKNQEFLYTIF